MERLFDSIAPVVTGAVGTETAQRAARRTGCPTGPGTTVGLSGLQQAYQRTLTGSPTTEVVAAERGRRPGQACCKRWTGSDGSPSRPRSTARSRSPPTRALARLPGSAAIVAVQAGTGQILAVAAHQRGPACPRVEPAGGQVRARPGVHHRLHRRAAGDRVRPPARRSRARAQNTVGGIRASPTSPAEADLGAQPPFSVDFAHACGTAFAGLVAAAERPAS